MESPYRTVLVLDLLNDIAAVQLVAQLAVVFQRPDAVGYTQPAEIAGHLFGDAHQLRAEPAVLDTAAIHPEPRCLPRNFQLAHGRLLVVA